MNRWAPREQRYPPPAPNRAEADKPRTEPRYGWCMLYNDFTGHPKWRLVSQRCGVPLAAVHAIVTALLNQASKSRKHGWIGGFKFDECAVALDLTPDSVASVYRVLIELGWIDQDYIVDWTERQPSQVDATATERKRTQRAREKAARNIAMKRGTADDEAMLTRAEQDSIARLAERSRVTEPAPELPPAELQLPTEEPDARKWLLGDPAGKVNDYGPASRIVAEQFGCNRLSADMTIRSWLRDQMAGDAIALATIISAVYREAFTGAAFRATIEQRIAAVVTEREKGPSLNFGPTLLKGAGGAA